MMTSYFISLVLLILSLFLFICNLYFFFESATTEQPQKDLGISRVSDQTIHSENINYLELLHNEITKEKKTKILRENNNYLQMKPFPHAVIDNFFPDVVLAKLSEEIPDQVQISSKSGCATSHSVCVRDNIQHGKGAINLEEKFGPATTAMFSYLRSSTFLLFLEKLTNIKGLIPDPHYVGSGVHQTVRNGFLKVHSDANTNNRIADPPAHRRVNLFVFFNEDWHEEYGGQMELWSKDLQFCEQFINPIFNRLVVFSTTDFTWHGHQTPLNTPETKSRRSLALYYYTIGYRPNEECFDNDCKRVKTNGSTMTTIKSTACSTCLDLKCRRWK